MARQRMSNALRVMRFKLSEAQVEWDRIVQKIQTVPNEMNVDGLWQAEQLQRLATLRIVIQERKAILRELTGVEP